MIMAISAATASLITGLASAAATAGAGVASGVQAGKLNRKNREWQEKMYGVQRQDAIADRDFAANFTREQNEYYSYPNQVELAKQAGLNPATVFGSGASGVSPVGYNVTGRSSDAPLPSQTTNPSSAMQAAAVEIGKFINASVEAQASKENADSNSRNADTREKEVESNVLLNEARVLTEAFNRGLISEKTANQQLENDFLSQTLEKRVAVVTEQLQNLKNNNELLSFQSKTLQAKLPMIQEQIANIEAQTRLYMQQVSEIQADMSLNPYRKKQMLASAYQSFKSAEREASQAIWNYTQNARDEFFLEIEQQLKDKTISQREAESAIKVFEQEHQKARYIADQADKWSKVGERAVNAGTNIYSTITTAGGLLKLVL